jgi:hypothetical protein
MNLKESFRYQNKLDEWLTSTTYYLSRNKNVMKTTQEHMRNKANADAQDETIDVVSEDKSQHSVNTLIDFVMSLLDEKASLTKAIDIAKKNCGIDIDGSVSINRKKQEVSKVFSTMANIKPVEKTTSGRAYKFNVAGDQTGYSYDIKEVSVIDFDRNVVKKNAKKLMTECDEVSAKIDEIMIGQSVDYTPIFDVNDSYDDVLEQFSEGK